MWGPGKGEKRACYRDMYIKWYLLWKRSENQRLACAIGLEDLEALRSIVRMNGAGDFIDL